MADALGPIEVQVATELVKALVAGGVELVKKVPALFRRSGRRKEEQRAAQLAAAAAELAAADDAGRDRAADVQRALWAERFADLLADHPEAATDLAALLAELRSADPGAPAGTVIEVHAGRDAYTAGRDMIIGEALDRSGT